MAKIADGSKEEEIIRRHKHILEILSDGKRISSTGIIEGLKEYPDISPVKKTTICEDIKQLKAEGYDIDTKSGYSLKRSAGNAGLDDIKEYDSFCKHVPEEWLIMSVMSRRYDQYISFYKLCEELDIAPAKSSEESFEVSEPKNTAGDYGITEAMLRTCLRNLEKQGYICTYGKDDVGTVVSETAEQSSKGRHAAPSNIKYYHLTESAPVLSLLSEDDIWEFCDKYAYGGIATELADDMEILNKKISGVVQDIPSFDGRTFRTFGQKARISGRLKKKIEDFLKLPFKTRELLIRYNVNGEMKDIRFMTGLLVFSVEKNALYLLGESEEETVFLRFDKCDKIEEFRPGRKKKNTIYESSKFTKMRDESWSAPAEEECEVEILFQDVPYVRFFVKELETARGNTANVIYPKREHKIDGDDADNHDGWIIYRDKMRGVNDLLPYIRSMGASAVIIKPESKRKLVMEKTEELIEKYKELHEKWENTQTRTQDCQK